MIKDYVQYLKDNPKGYWFKRKLYGWGWTPVSWQGWAVIILYVALVCVFVFTVNETSPKEEVIFTAILPITLLTITLIRICYRKGEKPGWMWGLPKKGK